MTTLRILLALASVLPVALPAGAQALVLDSPSEITVEIKRAEAAWNAWRAAANPKLEITLLNNPNAIADIDRDQQGAIQYLSARRRVYEKLAGAFAAQIETLRAGDPQLNASAAQKAEKQRLSELLDLENRISAADSALPDPAKDLLRREQRARDLKTINDLERSVTRRLENLGYLNDDERAARQQLDTLVSALDKIRQHFNQMAEATGTEEKEWREYLSGLRDIVTQYGVVQSPKGGKNQRPEPAGVNKLHREK